MRSDIILTLAGYEFEENEKKVYESLCPEVKLFFQNKENIPLKEKATGGSEQKKKQCLPARDS